MKKHFAHAALAAVLLCSSAVAAMMLPTQAAIAAEKDGKEKAPTVSHDVGAQLNEAIKAAQAKDYKTAMDKIQAAEAVDKKTDFDVLKINQIKAFIAIQQQDYATAGQAYEAVATSPAFADMDAAEQKSTLHNAMLLSAQAKHWPQVITEGTRGEQLNALDEKGYAILAQAYYFTNDYTHAQQAAQKSVDMATAKGLQPQLGSLQIIMSAQAKGNDQTGALNTLELLAKYYGQPGDWGQLIDHTLGAKGIKELDALYLYRLRFMANATSSPDDYTIAAGIALHDGYPAEAQAILEKGVANGKLARSGKIASQLSLARSGVKADERSLKAIAAAAQRSKSGEQDVKLAEDYWGYGRYADAETVARRAISKGGMKDPSEGQFILGISLVAQGKNADAQQALQQVDGTPARAAAAHLWDLYAQYKAKYSGTSTAAAAPTQQ